MILNQYLKINKNKQITGKKEEVALKKKKERSKSKTKGQDKTKEQILSQILISGTGSGANIQSNNFQHGKSLIGIGKDNVGSSLNNNTNKVCSNNDQQYEIIMNHNQQ